MNVIINSQTFPGEYLTTPDELRRGMMGRNTLKGCMIFKMDKGHHSFWMKDCLIELDIIFVNNNRISHIHRNCPPSGNKLNPPKYTGIGDHVIEFPGGTSSKWKIGDKVTMYLGSPINPINS